MYSIWIYAYIWITNPKFKTINNLLPLCLFVLGVYVCRILDMAKRNTNISLKSLGTKCDIWDIEITPKLSECSPPPQAILCHVITYIQNYLSQRIMSLPFFKTKAKSPDTPHNRILRDLPSWQNFKCILEYYWLQAPCCTAKLYNLFILYNWLFIPIEWLPISGFDDNSE